LDKIKLFDPKRAGERSPKFQHPEWLIVRITMLSVKLKTETHLQIYKVATAYWGDVAFALNFEPAFSRM
jgi:hypothetical protein